MHVGWRSWEWGMAWSIHVESASLILKHVSENPTTCWNTMYRFWSTFINTCMYLSFYWNESYSVTSFVSTPLIFAIILETLKNSCIAPIRSAHATNQPQECSNGFLHPLWLATLYSYTCMRDQRVSSPANCTYMHMNCKLGKLFYLVR